MAISSKLSAVAISKVERLMNLVICLLSTRTYVTAERIRTSVAGYSDSPSDEAFSRMFERDKNELRDLGIPLETGKVSSFDATEGYRIRRDAYGLPDITLTADESAAVAVATQLWQSPELVTAAQGALMKLRAAGVDVDPAAENVSVAAPAAMPGGRGSESVLRILLSAIDSGQAVQFGHRPSRTEPYVTRTVEPWGVVTDRGRWYLVGHDRDRDATRTFRLSRIADDVAKLDKPGTVRRPDDADLRAIVARAVGDGPVRITARVWIAEGRAQELRRMGAVVESRRLGERDGDIVEIEVASPDRLVRSIASHGADAVALEPVQVRDEVIARLQEHAADEPLARRGSHGVTA